MALVSVYIVPIGYIATLFKAPAKRLQHIATLLGATDVAYVWPPCCDVLYVYVA